jgi:hypothetical protein
MNLVPLFSAARNLGHRVLAMYVIQFNVTDTLLTFFSLVSMNYKEFDSTARVIR